MRRARTLVRRMLAYVLATGAQQLALQVLPSCQTALAGRENSLAVMGMKPSRLAVISYPTRNVLLMHKPPNGFNK